jgi:hypothetical protein
MLTAFYQHLINPTAAAAASRLFHEQCHSRGPAAAGGAGRVSTVSLRSFV